MQNREQDPGPADGGPGEDGPAERDGPRFPHVDEIEIPEGLSVEAVEPVGRSEESGKPRRSMFGRWLSSGIGRIGTGLRGVVDRALLVATFVAPLLILAYQSFAWLRTSHWPSVTMEGLLAWSGVPAATAVDGWPGLSGLLERLLEAPLAAVLFVGGFALHLLLSLLVPSVRRD